MDEHMPVIEPTGCDGHHSHSRPIGICLIPNCDKSRGRPDL